MAGRDDGDHQLRLQDSVRLRISAAHAEPILDFPSKLDLSPSTQQNVGLLLSAIQSGDAQLHLDGEGKVQVEYASENHVDVSKSHTIQEGKNEKDVQMKVNICLEMFDAIKHQRAPAGVILDNSKVRLGPMGTYKEGRDFQYLEEYLGKGNCAGGISVAVDKRTNARHGVKKVLISDFRTDEVRAWYKLNDSDSFPTLYLFRLEDNKVFMHMEEIQHAVTLEKIIDEHMMTLRNQAPELVRPFSLCLFHDLLSVVKEMHDANWAHNDLHGGNVMLTQDTMKVKLLDFGLSSQLKDGLEFNHRSMKNDILNALRLFCGVYIGCDFENSFVLEKEINNKTLHQVLSQMLFLSEEDREELLELITMTYQVTQNSQQAGYGDTTQVQEHIEGAIYKKTNKTVDDVMRIAAAYLFPKFYHDYSLHAKGGVDAVDSRQATEEQLADVDIDAAAAAIPEDFLNRFRSIHF